MTMDIDVDMAVGMDTFVARQRARELMAKFTAGGELVPTLSADERQAVRAISRCEGQAVRGSQCV